eukprot:Sspe_Gene.86047::Locus_56788_Transcript_1_3_Confidence_0.600_Length_354::g.86047::m.86047
MVCGMYCRPLPERCATCRALLFRVTPRCGYMWRGRPALLVRKMCSGELEGGLKLEQCSNGAAEVIDVVCTNCVTVLGSHFVRYEGNKARQGWSIIFSDEVTQAGEEEWELQ